MNKSQHELQAEILSALGHVNRIRILETLRNGEACNCQLAPKLTLEQSNLSRHLKLLVQAGILISWKDRLRVNFKVADARAFKILDLAASLAKQSVETQAQVLEDG